MPRISEPTLAQHRAARERALLDAAHELLLETGEAPTLPQVAARAGLARTSVYQYFDSKADLLQAMVRDVFPRWTERVTSAMASAPTAPDRILAYAAANVQLVADGSHAVGAALASLAPGEELDEQAARLHDAIREPLVTALEEVGVEGPGEVAELIGALVHGATRMLEAGADHEPVLHRLGVILAPLVRELGGTGQLPTEA
ncbi:TetR family transcriptional regulator [Ornithinimicrobium humiphilum]|uniref:TetR family transcriptional regulator n=1 Tax=Ornithinimicrobium humiphilum TaxID=125288 RepID=A0A543KM48_9MICO|nr:TetR/AcrR family transcriptional regulator [Ornithinimicrobium humiphilum]TQM96148.1 TetR family transcriptional regulator [Ornithinimicrobium humiphilum]